MAAPSYTTDLTTIVDFDGTSGTAAEPTATWTAGRSPINNDTDFPIQSSTHASLTMNTTGKAGLLATGSSFSWTSGDYLFGWIIWLAPGAIAAEASGGLAMLCGSSTSDFKVFYIGGNSSGLYPYGGWQNFAVDPTMTADETIGTTPTSFYVVGCGANVLSAVSKGNPLGFDAFRYGRGALRVADGDGSTPATFTGMAAANDASAARWGLFQAVTGSYKYKGLMYLGYGSATTFVDSNKNIIIDYSKYVQSSFNAIEIHNASSSVSWTNISITSLSTVSRGTLTVVDDATVTFDSCTFTDMDTFTFLSNSSVTNTVFRRCNAISLTGAPDLTGSQVLTPTVAADASALSWTDNSDPDGNLDDMVFSKGTNAHHAISFGASTPTEMTLRGISFTGFNASNSQNDSTLYFARSSGDVTVNLVGCSGNISYKSAGCTVTFVQNPVTFTVHVVDLSSNDISGARVLVYPQDGTGPLPYQDSVSIVRSSSTATVTHTAHGFSTNQKVWIEGATQPEYNGVFTITVTGADSYTYTVSGTPDTPATGSPTCTAAIIYGATDSNGEISDTRTYSADQLVSGRVRKASSGDTLYKPAQFSGSIDSTSGGSVTVSMIEDV